MLHNKTVRIVVVTLVMAWILGCAVRSWFADGWQFLPFDQARTVLNAHNGEGLCATGELEYTINIGAQQAGNVIVARKAPQDNLSNYDEVPLEFTGDTSSITGGTVWGFAREWYSKNFSYSPAVDGKHLLLIVGVDVQRIGICVKQ